MGWSRGKEANGMTLHYNIASQTALRRHLRSHLSKAEAVMWQRLSRKQMYGCKFRRQHGVDRYVLDFYCPELKLAIEIDGETHNVGNAKLHDQKRQEHIEQYEIHFLRFTNLEVLTNLNMVLTIIGATVDDLKRSLNKI